MLSKVQGPKFAFGWNNPFKKEEDMKTEKIKIGQPNYCIGKNGL